MGYMDTNVKCACFYNCDQFSFYSNRDIVYTVTWIYTGYIDRMNCQTIHNSKISHFGAIKLQPHYLSTRGFVFNINIYKDFYILFTNSQLYTVCSTTTKSYHKGLLVALFGHRH